MSKSPFEIRLDIIKQAYVMVAENTSQETPLADIVKKTFALAVDIKAFVDKS